MITHTMVFKINNKLVVAKTIEEAIATYRCTYDDAITVVLAVYGDASCTDSDAILLCKIDDLTDKEG